VCVCAFRALRCMRNGEERVERGSGVVGVKDPRGTRD